MGIRVSIEAAEGHTLRTEGVDSSVCVLKGYPPANGAVFSDSHERGIAFLAGSQEDAPYGKDGGYMRIGVTTYHVFPEGPQSIEVTHHPLTFVATALPTTTLDQVRAEIKKNNLSSSHE